MKQTETKTKNVLFVNQRQNYPLNDKSNFCFVLSLFTTFYFFTELSRLESRNSLTYTEHRKEKFYSQQPKLKLKCEQIETNQPQTS